MTDIEARITDDAVEAAAFAIPAVIPNFERAMEVARNAIAAALPHLACTPAGPYLGGDVKQAVDMGVAVYSVDFGDEGTGLFVRLEDFNRKISTVRANS